MNEEEIKAIRSIEKLIKWLEKWNDKYEIVPEDKKYFEIILNLIEKQKEEIEQLKIAGDWTDTLLEQKVKEIEKKDKIIDKMIDALISHDEHFNYCDKKLHKKHKGSCQECIKEYFKNKVKESK